MNRIILTTLLLVTTYLSQAQKQLYPVRIGNSWGLIDRSGKTVGKADYTSIGRFSDDGYAVVEKEHQVGIIDTAGVEIIPCQYDMINMVAEGFFSVKQQGVWSVVNQNNETILDTMAGEIRLLGQNYLLYEELSGVGLAHIIRGVLVEPAYQSFKLDGNYIIATGVDFEEYLMDTLGNKILPLGYNKIERKGSWIFASYQEKWGAYDLDGNRLIQHDWVSYRQLGNFFVRLINKAGEQHLYSIAQKKIVYSTSDKQLIAFNNNYIQMRNRYGLMGLIDSDGDVALKDDYQSIQLFSDSSFRVRQNDLYGVVHRNGAVLTPMDYTYISNLSTSVALVQKSNKAGIMDKNGNVVLPIMYPPKNFNLDRNEVKYKNAETNGFQLFKFDDDGQLVSNKKFKNFKSLKIRTRTTTGGGNGLRNLLQNSVQQATATPYKINDTLRWDYHRGARKWGLWNMKTKRYKYPPKWHSIEILDSLGLTVVGLREENVGGRINTGDVGLKIGRVYGLFNNKHGVPISKMEFLDIRWTDITSLDMDIARCIFVGGKHGIIAKTGKILSGNYTYIGEFIEGKARATKKGRLWVGWGKKKKNIALIQAKRYFDSFMSGYHYDNDNLDRVYDAFEREGEVYCEDAEWGYLDAEGAKHCDYKYDYVTDYSNDRALIFKDGHWGMLDETANEVLVPKYDEFDFLPKAENQLYLIAQRVNLYGAVDDQAKVIVPVVYSKIRDFQEGRIAVRRYSRWGFVDENAKEIIPTKYRIANDFQEGLSVVLDNSRWGAIDRSGNMVVKAQYARMGNFCEGKAWVYLKRGKKGYINPQGKLLFSGKFSKLTDFKDGIARVYVRKKGWGLIDTKGNYILKPKKSFKRIDAFNEYGLAKVKVGDRYRLINRAGEFVGQRSYGLIRDFKEGYAVVRLQSLGKNTIGKVNLNFGFIDTTGVLVTNEDFRQLHDFSEGRAVFTGDKSKKGYINTRGEIIVEPQYFMAEDFENNRAVVWQSYNKTGIIDTTGTIVIPVKYNKIIDINEGLALVRRHSKNYYFVDEETNRHTPASFQGAYTFVNDVAPVKVGRKWGVLNKKGLQALTPKYTDMKPYKNGVSKVFINRLFGVVDMDGNVIIEPLYEYIDYVGNGLFRVEQGDKVGYLDMKGNWIWEMQ